MQYENVHKAAVHSLILGHLEGQINKYIDNTDGFKSAYTADFSTFIYGKNLLMVCSIIISQLLRNGIDGMDQCGFISWNDLKVILKQEIHAAEGGVSAAAKYSANDLSGFFDLLFRLTENPEALEGAMHRIIFQDLPVEAYENCGRGGRYGSRFRADGALLVRARYGHTIGSGIDLELAAGRDESLAAIDTLVHGTTWRNYLQIMGGEGIFSGSGLAVMMERMPVELSHFVDYTREGRHDEELGGLKDPVTVAKRHLPEGKKGTVVLIETKSVSILKEMDVRIYTANPPAGMFQVVHGNTVGSNGILGVPLPGLNRYHLFDVSGDERRYIGTADSITEAERIVKR